MSHRLISRSSDLKQLRDEGYEVEIRSGHLLVGHVPFLNDAGEVAYGTLVSTLTLAGDVTEVPSDHVARFAGGIPCGGDLAKAIIDHTPDTGVEGMPTSCTFSRKPLGGQPYRDYHHKMTTYIAIISQPALDQDPNATALTFRVMPDEDEESVFTYIDTATSRAGIDGIAAKLDGLKIAIVGLGGTGSYILDFVAKTRVAEIHLYDGDLFLQHNAFRSPGAASIEDLEQRRSKVEHHAATYARQRRGVIPHPYSLDESNVEELRDMSFVFIAADSSSAKASIIGKLIEYGIPFVDVGMGLIEVDSSIRGLLRATTGTPAYNGHLQRRISSGDAGGDDLYSQNIQLAELNGLNASLAVVKWKKYFGFYADEEREHHCVYGVGGNYLTSEDHSA
jgi:hypothetical protein